MHIRIRVLLSKLSLFALLGAAALAAIEAHPAEGRSYASAGNAAGARSGLQNQHGRYFRWSCPPGWHVSETNAGVTLTSPDGKYSASLTSILRSRGSRTPRQFLGWVFRSVPSYRNARIISVRELPSQRMSWQTWNLIEAVVTFSDGGLPVTGVWKVGVANYYGMNDALIVGYRAANPDFQRAKAFLRPIADSIVLTNASEANGNNTLIRPKNNPLDNSAIIKAGKNRDAARDRASQGWREGMMGSEPTYDPKTGQTYNSQFGTYNAARGGYVNPNRPDELLERGWPGHTKK